MIVIVLPVAPLGIGIRIIQIIAVVLIDQRRSDMNVFRIVGIVNANRLVRGIVDDLEKVRVGLATSRCRGGNIANDRNSWDQ